MRVTLDLDVRTIARLADLLGDLATNATITAELAHDAGLPTAIDWEVRAHEWQRARRQLAATGTEPGVSPSRS